MASPILFLLNPLEYGLIPVVLFVPVSEALVSPTIANMEPWRMVLHGSAQKTL